MKYPIETLTDKDGNVTGWTVRCCDCGNDVTFTKSATPGTNRSQTPPREGATCAACYRRAVAQYNADRARRAR